MSLSPVKYEILKTMLLQDKPERAVHIAKETGREFPPVMMHLIGLTRMGYTISPEKGHYFITEKGKRALGLPEINQEKAKVILAPTSNDKAFHFYAGLGKPLNLYAHGLQDFCAKIPEVTVDSVEFHINRGDFEAWFTGLGDAELAKKVALLKEKKLTGEELHRKMQKIAENQCIALAKLAGYPVSSQ
jgi:hypothetical protein